MNIEKFSQESWPRAHKCCYQNDFSFFWWIQCLWRIAHFLWCVLWLRGWIFFIRYLIVGVEFGLVIILIVSLNKLLEFIWSFQLWNISYNAFRLDWLLTIVYRPYFLGYMVYHIRQTVYGKRSRYEQLFCWTRTWKWTLLNVMKNFLEANNNTENQNQSSK